MKFDIVQSSKLDDPEGLDNSQPVGWGKDYPLDSVFVRTSSRTVADVVKRIKAERYQLDPEFQRDFVWSVDKQSRLIESCVMRIPLPVFYVAELENGRIAVVDGLQRLTTFYKFLGDEFALQLKTGEEQPPHSLNGKKFSELPVHLQERIEDTQLTLYILDAKAPEWAKLDIFERVNSGEPLTRQQMRNCIYNGPATQWLKKAADNTEFLKASGKSLDRKTMRDRETINRFCGFYFLGENEYKGDMDSFLGNTLKYMNDGLADLDQLYAKFRHSMHANCHIFKEHGFRKSLGWPQGKRSVLNIALFDVCSVLFADIDTKAYKENATDLRQAFIDLIGNTEFIHAITYSTNSTRQVKKRFAMARAAIEEVLP